MRAHTLFYYLFYKSGYIPKLLNLFGLTSALLAVIGTMFSLFGYESAGFLLFPNLPFELGIDLWLLIKGIRDGSEI